MTRLSSRAQGARDFALITLAAAIGAAGVVVLDSVESPQGAHTRAQQAPAKAKEVRPEQLQQVPAQREMSELVNLPVPVPHAMPEVAARPSELPNQNNVSLRDVAAPQDKPPSDDTASLQEPDLLLPSGGEEVTLTESVDSTGALSKEGARLDCLPGGLRAVLDDVASKFGPVVIVSTTHIHTDNHFRGSARESLHFSCKAVDFKVKRFSDEVLRYLRSRREVAGLNSYRGGLIHIDFNEYSVER